MPEKFDMGVAEREREHTSGRYSLDVHPGSALLQVVCKAGITTEQTGHVRNARGLAVGWHPLLTGSEAPSLARMSTLMLCWQS